MDKLVISFNPRKFGKIATFVVVIGGIAFGVVAGRSWYYSLILRRAEALLKDGYPMLASQAITPYREHFAGDEFGCRTLLAAYTRTRQSESFQWATESCAKNDVRTLDVVMARAEIASASGADSVALSMYKQATQAFRHPAPYLAMIPIYKRMHDDKEALKAIQDALREYPQDTRVRMIGLKLLSDAQKWDDARVAADLLKPDCLAGKSDIETRQLVAKVLEKTGDKPGAKEVLSAPSAPTFGNTAPPPPPPNGQGTGNAGPPPGLAAGAGAPTGNAPPESYDSARGQKSGGGTSDGHVVIQKH